MDTFRASDLTEEHLGHHIRGEGVDGVLCALRRVDDLAVDLVLDRHPWVVTLPAGRVLDPPHPLDCPPV